jgi:Holliday junction resolvase
MSDGELRKIFRKHLVGFDLLAVETGGTTSGVPDLNLAAPGNIEIWIEMKKADHWRTTIRPMQIGWVERRLRFNRRVFCAVRRADEELWMFHASQMRYLKNERVDVVPNIGHWTGGAAAWDWSAIKNILVS